MMDPHFTHPVDKREKKRTIAIIRLVTIIGVALLMGITIWSHQVVSATSAQRNLATFTALADDNGRAMRNLLHSYKQSLDSGAALFSATDEVSLAQWKTFVDELDIQDNLPGINGIGYIQPVLRTELDSYLQWTRDRGIEAIDIHPQTDFSEIFSITYIEPQEPNKEAVGLDIAFESNRRQAAYKARDTGRATITKRIFLVQDKTRSAGFLLLRPVYFAGLPLDSAIERRAAFRGWIYAPFIASRFMKGLTVSQESSLDIEVYDGTSALESELIHASNQTGNRDWTPLYSVKRTFPMMEQNWTVVWKSTPEFEASVATQEPLLILLGGSALTIVFMILMLFYARREAYVQEEVRRKTQELVIKEREVSTALAQAEIATEAKSNFLANMSHEIRTPMNGVIGFTQLLDDGNLNEQQQRYVQMISESGSAMMSLLNDILDISKVDAGLMAITNNPIDVRHILESCVKLVSPTAETKDLDLVLDIDPDFPQLVMGDGLRLRQVVLNLLGNAVKFTERGQITSTVNYEPPRVLGGHITRDAEMVITVKDTGIGVPEDRINAIFDPFQQADDSTARKYGGTGLGLSISSQLVTLMGGRIMLASEVGQGSEFTITLPAEEFEAPQSDDIDPQQPNAQETSRPKDRPGRILIAEDHDVNQMLMGEMLAKLGFEYDVAADGAEAFRSVADAADKGQQYDLVLMDIQMPNVDGLQATRMIRNEGISEQELPIVALTANAFQQDVENCLAVGMQAHLAKPFAVKGLQDILAQWIIAMPATAPSEKPLADAEPADGLAAR